MRVVDERREVGRRGVKRDEQKRGQGCTGDGIVCSACVCVVYYKLLYKGVITTLFLFVCVQKVPLECNNSRSLSHTLIPSSTIQHGKRYEQNLCLPHVYFKKGTTIASKGKHTRIKLCAAPAEHVKRFLGKHRITVNFVFKAEEV